MGEQVVNIGKLRTGTFLSVIERIMNRRPEYEVTVELIKEGWFSNEWRITTKDRYCMTNVLTLLDDQI